MGRSYDGCHLRNMFIIEAPLQTDHHLANPVTTAQIIDQIPIQPTNTVAHGGLFVEQLKCGRSKQARRSANVDL